MYYIIDELFNLILLFLNLIFRNDNTDAQMSAKHLHHYITSLHDIKMNED